MKKKGGPRLECPSKREEREELCRRDTLVDSLCPAATFFSPSWLTSDTKTDCIRCRAVTPPRTADGGATACKPGEGIYRWDSCWIACRNQSG